MKNRNFNVILLFFLFLIMILSCDSDLWKELGRSEIVKKGKLKSFVYNGRQYNFFYNKYGKADSIKVKEGTMAQYVYKIWYHGLRIDSVSLIDEGKLISTHKDFKYDKKLQITQYTYFKRTTDTPTGVPATYVLSYDHKDRINSIDSNTQYLYDAHNNIATCSNSTGNSLSETSFEYDDKRNPLYAVPDLCALLTEEPFYWTYILSQHNSIVMKDPASETVYRNEYDSKDRLIKKTGERNGIEVEECLFTYYD